MELPFPFGGHSETRAASEQEPGTTRQEQNCHGVNPVDGRMEGAQRRGLARHSDGPLISGARIQALEAITYDSKTVDFAERVAGEELITWSADATQFESARAPCIDVQGNSYVIEGRGTLVKRNKDGVKIWTFQPPSTSDQARLLSLAIDQDDDTLYTAIGSGGLQKDGRIWKLTQKEDAKVVVSWTISVDGYAPHLRILNSELYVGLEQPDYGNAALLKYGLLFTDTPELLQRRDGVPYPLGGMAVAEDGAVYTTHPASENRGVDPRTRDATAKTHPDFMWTPRQLLTQYTTSGDSAARRLLWSWQHSEDVGALGVEQGQQVTLAPDRTGQGRDWFQSGTGNVEPPYYVVDALAGNPAIRFSGLTAAGKGAGLDSASNFTLNAANGEQQGTLLPAWKDGGQSRYVVTFLCRTSLTQNSGVYGPLWHQDNAQSTDTHGHGIYFNCAGNLSNSNGNCSLRLTTGLHALAPVDPSMGLSIVTVIYTGADALTGVAFRYNGTETAFVASAGAFYGLEAAHIGWDLAQGASARQYFEGDIFEAVSVYCGSASFDPMEDGSVDPTEIAEKIEGYMAHRIGYAHLLPAAHPYSLAKGPPRIADDSPEYGHLLDTDAMLLKWGASRFDLKATHNPGASGGTSRGLGFAVEVDAEKRVWTMGPYPGVGIRVLQFTDQGDTFSNTIPSADLCPLGSAGTADAMYGAKMAVDGFGNCYIPLARDATLAGALGARVVGLSPGMTVVAAVALPEGVAANGVACSQEKEDYVGDPVTRTETIWVAAELGTVADPDKSTHKVSLVSRTLNGGNPRTTTLAAVAGGKIFSLSPTTVEPTLDEGVNDPPLDPDAVFIDSTAAFGKVFFTDGANRCYFDPRLNKVFKWDSATAGAIPEGFSLLELWRGRVMLGRFPDDPQNWFALAQDDPFDADTRPEVTLSTQAIEGNTARAGKPSDILTAIMPWNEDTVLLGGDHTITQLSGDPMAAGTIDRAASKMDLLSPTVGVAFGRAWCRDRDGALYFHDTRGGVYRLVAGQGIQNLTDGKVEASMREVDFGKFRPVLGYDDEFNMLFVFYVAKDAADASADTKHFCLEVETEAWWTIKFASATLQPTCIGLIDGDSQNDRALVIGCEDGVVRKFSVSAPDDDGVAIESNFLVGPLAPEGETTEYAFHRLTAVLANDQGGATYKLYGTDRADALGPVRRSGSLAAGRNPPIMNRVRGSYVAVEIGSAQVGNRWALASPLQITPLPRGSKKVRQ